VDDCIPSDVLDLARALAAAGLAPRRPDPEPGERPPYTVPEAADMLRVHESTLYRAIQDGDLGAYSAGSGGRAIRIPAGELDAFKARRMIRRPGAVA
jgi:excisionase family DNA binding protein